MIPEIDSILVISDVSVGYGTPQVVSMARSLARDFGAVSIVVEPDQPERPPVLADDAELQVRRIYTATHPYTTSGQLEYNRGVAALVDEVQPDIVVICSFLGAAHALVAKHRPRLTIYYGLEHTDGGRPLERAIFSMICNRIDMAIFPEENRAVLDAPRLGLDRVPTAIVYNGCAHEVTPLPAAARNGRFFYGGLLHPEFTCADHFFSDELARFRIDLFGLIDGYRDPREMLHKLAGRGGSVSYHGYVSAGQEYFETLRAYSYSVILWNPIRESMRFAAPNKFFDAIEAGVPPLVAPHPLCQTIVRRYGFGVLMQGWSLSDVAAGFRQAEALRRSGEYERMMERAPRARADLSWAAQYEKASACIRGLLGKQTRRHGLAAGK